MAGLLSIEREGDVALVTLRRAEKRNALSIELRQELAESFDGLSEDETVGCIVLTGAGSAFCSGMDTSQFGGDLDNRRRLVETSAVAFQALRGCRRPVVAAVNGPALAGGFALALLCDLRVAASVATFGYPELPRGSRPATPRHGRCFRRPSPRSSASPVASFVPPRRSGSGSSARSSQGTSSRARSSSHRESPACRDRRSSRPSAGRCSSAATSGASSSTRRRDVPASAARRHRRRGRRRRPRRLTGTQQPGRSASAGRWRGH